MPQLPIYCINLLRSPERLAYVHGQAAHCGVTITRIDAVDARLPEHRQSLDALPADGPTGTMGLGTRACTLSHARAWQTLLDDPAQPPFAVVLEDDVNLSADFGQIITTLSQAAHGYDLVKLESYGPLRHGALLARDGACQAGQPLALALSPTRKLRRCYQLAPGSAGYLISRKAAAQALQTHARSNLPVDHFLFYPRRTRASLGLPYGVVAPGVCEQSPSFNSDIAHQRNADARWQRDLQRTPYEVAQAPGMLSALVSGRAWFLRSPFVY